MTTITLIILAGLASIVVMGLLARRAGSSAIKRPVEVIGRRED